MVSTYSLLKLDDDDVISLVGGNNRLAARRQALKRRQTVPLAHSTMLVSCDITFDTQLLVGIHRRLVWLMSTDWLGILDYCC